MLRILPFTTSRFIRFVNQFRNFLLFEHFFCDYSFLSVKYLNRLTSRNFDFQEKFCTYISFLEICVKSVQRFFAKSWRRLLRTNANNLQSKCYLQLFNRGRFLWKYLPHENMTLMFLGKLLKIIPICLQ